MRIMSLVSVLMVVVAACDCSSDGDSPGSGADGSTSTSGMDGSTGTTLRDGATGVDSPWATDPSGRVLCGDRPCQCDDGIDNDGDGLIDGLDPECTGPYDDDESSFATGIPGDNIDFCQDCFFDGNSGQGDDGCAYHTECLYGRTPPGPGTADCFNCDVSDRCVNFCRARTPNGCDCFGCCEVRQADGSTVNIFLAAECSLANLDDETACPRCVQSTQCVNECGECELCPGRTIEDLPASCYDDPDGGTPMYTCDDGEQVCSDTMPCGAGFYCQQGCCLSAPI